jgi:hypothetical protein
MRHNQVIAGRAKSDATNVAFDEIHSLARQSFFRKSNHSTARFHAIDFCTRILPNEFSEESPVPFSNDENAVRRRDFSEEGDPRYLKSPSKDDGLEPAIMRRDAIEIHPR